MFLLRSPVEGWTQACATKRGERVFVQEDGFRRATGAGFRMADHYRQNK